MTRRILLQLDTDPHPSSFDSVVAVDSGVDQLFRYQNVDRASLTAIVHGAMFTRGGDDLRSTAIFVGGSDVARAEELFHGVQETFFGPVRVSVMLDASGCNTTAAAAVVAAGRHVELNGCNAVVLGGTGPVGKRVAQLLAGEGANVRLTSRSLDRAQAACDFTEAKTKAGSLSPAAISSTSGEDIIAAMEGASVVIGCGAAGTELIEEQTLQSVPSLKVAIDLNAVPPSGIGGVGPMDKAKPIGGAVAYGAIGIGGLKMKTHRAAIQKLFEKNDVSLDAIEIYQIACSLG